MVKALGRWARRDGDGGGGGGRTPPLPRAAARDARASRRARGILAELWSHRPGWSFTVAALYASTRLAPAVEGREALYRAVAELRAIGYVVPAVAGTADGWTTRYRLDRSAAPDDDTGYVHVPWSVVRDHRLSYRARGLLVERLSYGTTVRGQTVVVHRGGITALATDRQGEGHRATTTTLGELMAVGYAVRTRTRDHAGRLDWATVLRSFITDGPIAPVDNEPPADDGPTCADAGSPQVTPTMPFPDQHFQEDHDTSPTCGISASPQVTPTMPFPGTKGDDLQGREEGEESGVLCVSTAQEVDARAKPTPLRGDNDRTCVRLGAPAHRRPRRAPVSRIGWDALAQLPRPYRDGAPGWVRRELAHRLEHLIEDGLTAAAIVATAHRVAAERPISGDHVAALRAAHARLRADLAAGDICGTCGAERWTPHGRCPLCDDEQPLTDRERAQLAAIWEQLGATAPCPADNAWRPP